MKKILYSMEYNGGEFDILLKEVLSKIPRDISLLSEKAQSGLIDYVFEKAEEENEPPDENLSQEACDFVEKCVNISKDNYLNLTVTQTLRELIAEFTPYYAEYEYFGEIYRLADKIIMTPVNDMLFSIKFTLILRK